VNECLLGADRSESKHFWVAVLPELTIYGHDVNAFTRKRYPEDWPHVRDVFASGMLWGCFHSQVVADGEIGSQDPGICVPLYKIGVRLGLDLTEHELFERFAELGWPDLQLHVGLTSNRPLVRILVGEEGESPDQFLEGVRRGTLREAWNSLEGDKDAPDQAREN